MVDPISSEELDIAGNIHRYNFGWMVTRTIVTIGGSASLPGLRTESTTTAISGNNKLFSETVTQQILPPSLDLPGGAGVTTGVERSMSIGTYYRIGRKKRTYTKARVFGTSQIVALGETPFAVLESKEYANAMSSGGAPGVPGFGDSTGHVDGGAQYTIANGVKTKTDIKG